MTEIRKEAMELLERMPDDEIFYILQIMKGIEGLYEKIVTNRKSVAFEELMQLQFAAPDLDEKKELEEYREGRYADIT